MSAVTYLPPFISVLSEYDVRSAQMVHRIRSMDPGINQPRQDVLDGLGSADSDGLNDR